MYPATSNPGLDASWQVGLSLAHVQGLHFGSDLAFTYGPLGFLAAGQELFFRGALAALLYAVLVALALYAALCAALRRWLPMWGAVAATAAFSFITPVISGADLGTVAVLVAAVGLLHPSVVRRPLPRWLPPLLGALAALQLQVKFSVGTFFIVVTAVVTLARPGRWRAVATSTGGFLVALPVLWLLAGQRIGDLVPWLRTSMSLASGYGDAMAISGVGIDRSAWWFLAVPVAFLVVVAAVLLRRGDADHRPLFVLVAVATWFLTKQGFVRLDDHRNITFAALAAAVLALPWQGRARPPALAVAAFSASMLLVHPVAGWQDRVEQMSQWRNDSRAAAWRLVELAFDPARREERLASMRADILAAYRVEPAALEQLVGTVHADPVDVSAVWASERPWRPVPVFQDYVAYTDDLDRMNAEALADDDAPDSVLRPTFVTGVDGRVVAWESPEYQVALTCLYDVAYDDGTWQVLHRRTDGSRCREPVLLDEQRLAPGETGAVPAPASPDSLVVVRFSYPVAIVDTIATAALKPPEVPVVELGEFRHRFVSGHAENQHLVHVPSVDAAGAPPPNAGFVVPSLTFPTAAGTVVARYYEIPTG